MNQRRNAVITRKHSSGMRTARFCIYSGYGIRGRVGLGIPPGYPTPHTLPPLDSLPPGYPTPLDTIPMPYPLDSLPLMPSPLDILPPVYPTHNALPPGYPTTLIPYPLDTLSTWKGHRARDILPPQKEHGTGTRKEPGTSDTLPHLPLWTE